MRLSVVIPTFNRPDALPRTLAALDAQTADAESFEVVVAEDPKNDAPLDLDGHAFALRRVRGAAPGASAARNAGWHAASAPVVLFIGDDILAAPQMLERHMSLHERHPGDDVGVLGHVRWARELPRSAFMAWLDQGVQFDYGTIRGSEAGPGHFYTSNVSLKRAALEATGGFDAEAFPFLYEDIDLGVRLFERGFRLIYEPQADAEHLHEPRLDDWKRRMAAVGRAERAWVARHPEAKAYFHDRFAEALRRPRLRGRRTGLIRWIPRTAPVIGHRLWDYADVWFGQQLGPQFMEGWKAAG